MQHSLFHDVMTYLREGSERRPRPPLHYLPFFPPSRHEREPNGHRASTTTAATSTDPSDEACHVSSMTERTPPQHSTSFGHSWWTTAETEKKKHPRPSSSRAQTEAHLRRTFEPMQCDAETEAFLSRASATNGKVWKWILSRLLYRSFSFTFLHGLLKVGEMFVVSSAQLRILLREEGVERTQPPISGILPFRDPVDTEKEEKKRKKSNPDGRQTTMCHADRTLRTNQDDADDQEGKPKKHHLLHPPSSSSSSSMDLPGTVARYVVNASAYRQSVAWRTEKLSTPHSSPVKANTLDGGRGDASTASTTTTRSRSSPPSMTTSVLPRQFTTLLDIGAGDGNVTEKFLPFCHDEPYRIHVTEVSATMRYRLGQRGFTVLDAQHPFLRLPPLSSTRPPSRRYFDLISCLNVLDRADTPRTLLSEMRASLAPGGYVLLAVVLPWCPFVEVGHRQARPSEMLPMHGGECCKGATFEASLITLVDQVLQPMGYEVVRWTRLPYICDGNLSVQYSVLSDAVLVLKDGRSDKKNEA